MPPTRVAVNTALVMKGRPPPLKVWHCMFHPISTAPWETAAMRTIVALRLP